MFKSVDVIILIPFALIGIALIVLAIYSFIKRIQLERGEDVDVKVIKAVPHGELFLNYITFEYKGKTIEKEMIFDKALEEGKIYKGRYSGKGKNNNLIVDGRGFYSSLGGEIILLAFGIFLLFLYSQFLLGFPTYFILIALAVLFITIFISFKFFYKSKMK